MHIGNAFPSAYIKASDLQGRTVTVMMDRVVMEDIGGDQKPILYFLGKDRGLVLNKTNSNIIAEMYGWETDDWQGKQITLMPARVEFQGKIVDAVRVRLVDTRSQQVAAPLPAAHTPTNGTAKGAPMAAVLNDEVPF